jgi:hypothetical protein
MPKKSEVGWQYVNYSSRVVVDAVDASSISRAVRAACHSGRWLWSQLPSYLVNSGFVSSCKETSSLVFGHSVDAPIR